MIEADYKHLKREFNTLKKGYCLHHNFADQAAYKQAINDCMGVLDRYFAYCDAINHHRIPYKDGPEYKHNNHVGGTELEGYCERWSLYGGDPKCKHEVYGQISGGVKCIKCGAWYCA